LVGSRAERQGLLALVINEPAPARALDASGACAKDADEFINAAPTFYNGIIERATVRQVAVSL